MKLKTLLLMTLTALAVIPASRAVAAHIYWCDFGGNVYRANLNGNNVEHLIDLDPGAFEDIALDIAAGKMYLADVGEGRVLRANVDGTSVENVLDTDDLLSSVALDTIHHKIYWAISGQNDAIQRADLDGSHIENVIHPAYLSAPERLAIDPLREKVYWTGSAESSGAIRSVNFSGSGLDNLVLHENWPIGIALDLDAGKIYWADSGYSYDDPAFIRRCNLDATEVEDLYTEATATRGLALDLVRGKIYWAQSSLAFGEIWRANLDGSDAEVVVTGLDPRAQGIAIDPYPIPEPSAILVLFSAALLCVAVYVLRLRRLDVR